MALTYKDLQDSVLSRATRQESGTQFDTDAKIAINMSLLRTAREALWRNLRRETTVSITSSTEVYNLPPQVSHRFFIWHEVDGFPYLMRYVPEQKFIGLGVDQDITGTPRYYRMWKTDMVQTQPTSASVITVVSSSSSDTNIKITIFGIVSGFPDYETITTNASNGTTSVSGSKSFSSVERIVKDQPSVGRITVTSNSGAVTVATIPVGDTTSGIVYRKIKLNPIPNASFTMNVYYYKDVYRLVNDEDVHELGQDFDEAIMLLAISKMKFDQNQDEGEKYFNLWRDEIRSLRRTNIDKVDWFPTIESQSDGRPSNALIHPYLQYQQAGANFGPRSR